MRLFAATVLIIMSLALVAQTTFNEWFTDKTFRTDMCEYLRLPLPMPVKTEMADIEIPAMFAYLSVSALMLFLSDRLLSHLFTRGRSNRI
ncbi:MAG: hypothetical protein FJY11_08400 [Bacteroidetes bacterium]|nr:hypothetical protein [Bacteroidota bacterium]